MRTTGGYKNGMMAGWIVTLFVILASVSAAGAQTYFSDDMETAGNWNGDAPWAMTTTDKHGGSKSWTDSPGANYGNSVNVSLTLATTVDLNDSTSPQLVFWHKYQMESSFDFGYVELSVDNGATWPYQLAAFTGISAWNRMQIDLSAFNNDSNVRIRFRLQTDKTVIWDGWSIDDVAIAEPPVPVAAFTVSNPSTTGMTLSWSKNLETDFKSYKIYRSTAPGVTPENSTLVTTITDQNTETYAATGLLPSTTYYYKIYVYNQKDIVSGSKEESGATLISGFSYPFSADMEGSLGGWTAQAPWAVVLINDSHTGAPSKIWTDSPDGAYAGGADTSLQFKVNLGAASMPVLSFWQKYALQDNSDYGYIEVKPEGTSTWSRLYFLTGTSASWFKESVDLSYYAGTTVDIRFRLTADTNGVQSQGWMIDDISVNETTRSAFTYPFADTMDGAETATAWISSSWALATPGHSGAYAWTDSPAGDYGQYVNSELVMASTIDLSTATHPQLSFWHKYDIRHCLDYSSTGGCDYYQWDYDYGYVYLSTFNGQSGTWVQLAGFSGSSDWSRTIINLQNYAGLPNVRLKFVLVDTMNDTVNYVYPGWTIDDVKIEEAPREVNLSLVSSGMNSVSLAWSGNNDSDFSNYALYRSSSPGVSGSSTLVATITNQAVNSYTDQVALIQPGVYYYRIWVIDEEGNYSLASNEIQATYSVPANSYPFIENGEGGTAQWSFGFPWGLTAISANDSHSGTPSMVWTDSPGSNYAANANTSLSTFLDLSSAVTPVLTFWHRYSLESAADYVRLEVSVNDGQSWTELRAFTGTENHWNFERVNLSDYTGNAHFGIRFRLTSNGSNQQGGWSMDDLLVAEEPISTGYPFSDDLESGPIPWFYSSTWGRIQLASADTYDQNGVSTVWTDSPEGSYAAGADNWLSLSIDLSSASMPELSFWQKYAFQPNNDGGYVEIRENGTSSWQRLYYVTGTSPGWLMERIDLAAYSGKQVEIRFRLVADNSIQSDGWFLDDIAIRETTGTPLAFPFIDHMETAATLVNWITSSWELSTDSHSGNYAFTDSPQGDYGALTAAALTMSSTISLQNTLHPQLSFWHKYDTRNCLDNSSTGGCDYYQWDYDYGYVYLSTFNGQPGTWQQLAAFKGSAGWTFTQLDLSPWAGLPTVRIKFVMSDTLNDTVNYTYPGWTIDDVAIEEAPVDVHALVTSSTMSTVNLTWNANQDSDFNHYVIYRSSSPGVSRSSILVATIENQQQTNFTDSVALIQPGIYYYRMWVWDNDGNVSLGSNEVVATYAVPANAFPFAETAESGSGRWSWGTPWGLSNDSLQGSHSWTDSPGANYAANSNSSLSTFLNLSGTSHPVLTFWHKYSLETGKDYLRLEVSTDDGNTWSSLMNITGSETEWNQERLDLTPYAGQAHLGLRFRLTSDAQNQQDGWFMDNMQVAEEAVEAGYPFFDTIENGIAPWFYDTTWGVTAVSGNESYNGVPSRVWTDSPGGSYNAGADSSLRLTIDLGAAKMPALSFRHKYSLDPNSDYGYIEVRENGTSTWTRIYFVTGVSPDWVKESVDLSGYAGKKINLRFRLTADSNGTQSDGWSLDDISIAETESASLPYPLVDDMDNAATPSNWLSSSWQLVSDDKHSGAYAWTDSPAGDYGALTQSSLTMASTISLKNAVRPRLSFWHKYDTRNCQDNSSTGGCDYYQWDYDYGYVYLSTFKGQPGTWVLIGSFKGTQTTWVEQGIDLSPWVGLPYVRIKFVMSDTLNDTVNYTYPGWTIDDIRIGEDLSVPRYILKTSGDNQVGETREALALPFVATIYDSSTSKPVSGIPVNIGVTTGGGMLLTTPTQSDANGLVSATLKLGNDSGANTVTMTIADTTESVTFSATGYNVGQPLRLVKFSGDNQVGPGSTQLPQGLTVKVSDIRNNTVAGTPVSFAVTGGSGALTVTELDTDQGGLAATYLTPGASAGQITVMASSTGLLGSPLTFTAWSVLSGGTRDDVDGDGMPDSWETTYSLSKTNPADALTDADSDGLSNREEYYRGTNPKDDDSDGDTMPDGWEIANGLDPLDPADALNDNDGDGAINRDEFAHSTTPVLPQHFRLSWSTDSWMDFTGSVEVNNLLGQRGDEIGVFDNDGVLCGRFTLTTPGEYGYLHVYEDDPATQIDEGATANDPLSFRIWDADAQAEVNAAANVVSGQAPPVWTFDGDQAEVDLIGAVTQSIPLEVGWNLISFSVKTGYYADNVNGAANGPPDVEMLSGTTLSKVNSLAEAFASIAGKYDIVRGYDAHGAHTFDPNPDMASFNDMKYLAPGYGYWIKMNTAANLTFYGIRARATDTLKLNAGWNLVGYWHPAVYYSGTQQPQVDFPADVTTFTPVNSVDAMITPIRDNYLVIRSYDGSAHTYDPMLGSFNDMNYMGPGYGYWIKIKSGSQPLLQY